jgi:hypothetical protein
VNLPRGAQIIPHATAMSQARTAGVTELHIHIGTPTLATQADIGRAVKAGLEYYVRQGGTLNIGKAVR